MLSRLALRNVQVLSTAMRGIQTTTSVAASEQPLPRPKRLLDPSPVRLGVIPDEWFTFFYPKTGVTGPYVFLATVGTYLVSKEWYVLEHEFYNSLSLLFIVLYGRHKFGKQIDAYLTKEVDAFEKDLVDQKEAHMTHLKEVIQDGHKEIERVDAQKMIFDVKKQNILMQLEATYRERMAMVHDEVKKRLDYHLQLDNIERRIAHKHMIQWIISNVMKAVTPDQEKAALQQCIKDLQGLAKA